MRAIGACIVEQSWQCRAVANYKVMDATCVHSVLRMKETRESWVGPSPLNIWNLYFFFVLSVDLPYMLGAEALMFCNVFFFFLFSVDLPYVLGAEALTFCNRIHVFSVPAQSLYNAS